MRELRTRLPILTVAAALALPLAACATRVPEPPPVPMHGKRAEARQGMVAASHPEAAAAGLEMLRRGGNAVDAAVATAFALGVVDPSQTGIGGYGHATVWIRGERRAEVYDFQSQSGADTAWTGPDTLPVTTARRPRQALVPGFVAGLLQLHTRRGRLPRATVLAPAIRLAREGHVIGTLMHRLITSSQAVLAEDPEAAAVFLPGGQPLRPGDRLVQPALAAILERIAAEGADAFYLGDFPRAVTAKLRQAGGLLDAADFASYRPLERRPACSRYLGYNVVGAAPQVSGHAMMAFLNVAELAGLERAGDPTHAPDAAVRLADALRVMSRDRTTFTGAPEWRPQPARGVASVGFARLRVPLIGALVTDSVPLADAWPYEGAPLAAGCERYDPIAPLPRADAGATSPSGADDASNTSHLSVIDAERNAVSLTSSVGVLFGSGVYASGMFLNSSATLFGRDQRAPRRKPTSALAPILLLDGDDVRLAIGAAGSGYIPTAVAQVTFRIAGLGQDPALALASPRVHPSPTSRTLEIEPGFALEVYSALRAHGYATVFRNADLGFAAIHAVQARKDGRLVGAADPRRDGAAMGY